MDILVIGGGPAGMMAAIYGKKEAGNREVVLFEKNEKLGKKLFITGKGRGNWTNSCEESVFMEKILRNPRFFMGAFRNFNNQDAIAFMEKNGCALKEERGGRIFPESNKAFSLTDGMKKALQKEGVKVCLNKKVDSIRKKGDVFLIKGNFPEVEAKKVIIATGGLSYPSTGSTGDGYDFAKAFSIGVTKTYPSLVKMEVLEEDVYPLSGLKLKHIGLKILNEKGKCLYEKTGELYFQKNSLLGPVVLSASAALSPEISEAPMGSYQIAIDLKAEMGQEQFDSFFLRDCESKGKEKLYQLLKSYLPAQLYPIFLKRLEKQGVSLEKKSSELKKEERRKILNLFHSFPFTVQGLGGFPEAIVTKGGVETTELSKKSLEAKRVPGLYFAGEVVDLDAYTGGFNMQIAISTGVLAGQSAGRSLKEEQ